MRLALPPTTTKGDIRENPEGCDWIKRFLNS
jgi:hypothetical protein